ncbi:unnamed protein product [Tuber melanosporum]|uniref:Glutamate decarboxylase n=1 Tax=Tuber melanosporum (strain Mel28) TaxID=656061 RepID=D5G7T6_TUBMM|nr:uncharacterized protein GSTUM_00004718001 [Tuber melanosporum]CAZ80579.1 unnamed protein product [Tuber melanosporum]
MSLSKHVDPDELIASLPEHPSARQPHLHRRAIHHYTYGSRYSAGTPIPKFEIPGQGTEAGSVHQLIKDELDLDGRPNLNLASFVNTYMETHADQLIMENIAKNLADADEYPALMAIHSRCVSMVSNLWNIPKGQTAIGTATTGSSEAIHLGGLAMKRRWQERRRANGKSTEKPNILMGANAQVALEKFARYFDVEPRIIPVSEESHWCLDPSKIRDNLDENTIGIFVILGSTYTGHFEPVEEVSNILDKYEEETGISIPIHVDGASGAMVAPFTGSGGKWGFELPRVHSINTSGHKYGLVYAGLGWIIWRGEEYLPKELIFELHYLGGTEQSYTLNFSRPGAQVLAQYFNFLHLGKEGYKTQAVGTPVLAISIVNEASTVEGVKEAVLSDDNPHVYNAGLPVVAFRLSDEFKKEFPHVKQASVSTLLRAKGYIIPSMFGLRVISSVLLF